MRSLVGPLLTAQLLLTLAVPAAAQVSAPVVDGVFPGGRFTGSLDSLVAATALPEEEDFRVVGLGRDEHSSHHLVYIRDREVPHRHDRHDLLIVVVRGSGWMLQGDEERPAGENSILFVPRGGEHAFRNAGSEPAVLYAVFIPGFDGTDRVDVAGAAPGTR